MSKMYTSENRGYIEILFTSAELTSLIETLDFARSMCQTLSHTESTLTDDQRQLLEQRANLAKALSTKLMVDGDPGRPVSEDSLN